MRAVAASAVVLVVLMTAAVVAPSGRSAFAVRAERVCAQTGEAAAAIATRRGPDDTAATHLLAQAELAREQLETLASLPATQDEQPAKTRLVSALAASADVLRDYARATRRGDLETRKALSVPGGPGQRTADATRAAAAALGLETCSRLA